jgi:hypothetical protein
MTAVAQARRLSIVVVSFAVFLVLAMVSLRLHAQANTATLSGTVSDGTGAIVSQAQVLITNDATGTKREVASNASGLYSAPSLAPGIYSVRVSAPGFDVQVRHRVTLDVGSAQLLNITMVVGSVTQEVTVSDVASTVDTTSSQITNLVGGKNMRDLPLNGRSWTDLAVLSPGVTAIQTQPPVTASDRPKRGLGGQLSINGGRPQSNSYVLDGININDYSNAGPGSVLGGNLGVDALQEFSVITTNPTAQAGRTSGGVISAVTRAGTNAFHGSVYEFFRDSALDTRNYNDTVKPPFRRNQYGASAGGPIQRDKTFIFGDYEGVRQNLGQTAQQNVPSVNARAGILSTGNVTPDPAAARFIAAFYPLPNGQNFGDTGIYSFVGSQVTTENYATVKLDHTWSAKDSSAVTYLYDISPSTQNDEFSTKQILSKTVRQTVSILETHVFSPSTLNTVHVGYNRDNAGSPYTATALKPAASDLSYGFVPGDDAGQVQVPGLTTFSGGLTSANPLLFRWNSFQGYDDLSHTIGRHSLSFGASIERIEDNQLSADTPGGYYQFNTLSDFITNQPLSLLATLPGTVTPRYLRQTIFGAYAQDDLRLWPNLTLNLGLRYEIASIPNEIHGKLSNLRVLAGDQPFLGSPYIQNPTFKNFEPRVGFAWDPFSDGKSSVRGAFGMYDALPLIVEMGSGVDASYPFAQNVSGNVLPIGSFPSKAFDSIANTATDHRVSVLQYHPPRNYIMQWNLAVQREVLPRTTLLVAYVGSRGVHNYYETDDGNIVLPTKHTAEGYFWPDPATSQVIDPLVGRVLVASWSGDSYFSGLETQLATQANHGLQGQVAYTWSRCIDTSSGSAASDQYRNSLAATLFTDARTHRGPCDTNIGQNLVINGAWNIPAERYSSRLAGLALRGWQLNSIFTASTGQPFSVTISGDPLGLKSVVPFDFPDRLKGPGCKSLVNPRNVLHYIKTECFAFPNPSNRMGNANRNELIGPGIANLDFSIFKTIPLKMVDGVSNLQLRVETYNLLNHADFSPPNSNNTIFDSTGNLVPGVGSLTDPTTLSSRQIQLAAKFVW